MIDEEQFKAATAAVMSDKRPVTIIIPIQNLWLAISAIQLSVRHPGLSTYMKQILTSTTLQMQAAITETHPEAKELLAAGWNTEHDQPSDVKMLCNCWTIYTAPGEDSLAQIGRPQDWGDPRWMYKVYTLEATIKGVRYRNECHAWYEGQIEEHKHLEAFAQLVALMLMPGVPRWKSGRDYLDEDDFWNDAWGKMPPFYPESDDDEFDNDGYFDEERAMQCPRDRTTMVDIDDCGDGTRGWECPVCGKVISEDDIPCPEADGVEPCYPIDGPHGERICAMCERDM